ncbi:MAG: helix-turn-helix transcriptional regulator [Myxococcales bacterium]|nr:helix-turn-helix transcriptional regulator [Myxococcales bacterium]
MSKSTIKKVKKSLPDRLAEVRGDRSQRQFAMDLGVFQQNINRYERGSTPHPDFLITLALTEGISVDWLLLGKGKKKLSGAVGARSKRGR